MNDDDDRFPTPQWQRDAETVARVADRAGRTVWGFFEIFGGIFCSVLAVIFIADFLVIWPWGLVTGHPDVNPVIIVGMFLLTLWAVVYFAGWFRSWLKR